jgi:hypothetical protein
MEQRDRIRPAGDGDQHAVAGRKQLVLFNRSFDLFVKRHCRKTQGKVCLVCTGKSSQMGDFEWQKKKSAAEKAEIFKPAQADRHYFPSPTKINGAQK